MFQKCNANMNYFFFEMPAFIYLFPLVIPPSIMGKFLKILKLIYFPEETCHIQDLDFCSFVLKFTFIITTNIMTYI